MLEFCLIKSTGFWNVLDTNNTQFVSSFPHFYLANEIKNSVQKNCVFNLPGISYSRNRTSRSLQECVLVCLVEWPNSVAISIDTVVKCPVILSPFWIDLDWTQKEKTIISMHWRRLRWCFDSMERLVMRRTRRFDCTHTVYELMVSVELTVFRFVYRFVRFYEKKARTDARCFVDCLIRSVIRSRCAIYVSVFTLVSLSLLK